MILASTNTDRDGLVDIPGLSFDFLDDCWVAEEVGEARTQWQMRMGPFLIPYWSTSGSSAESGCP